MVDEEPCFLFSFHAINIRHFRKTIEKRRKKRTKKKKKSKNIPSGNPALQSKSLSWSCKRKQKNSSTRFKWRYTHPILNKDQKQEISTNRQVGLRNKAGQWIHVVWLRKMASGEKKNNTEFTERRQRCQITWEGFMKVYSVINKSTLRTSNLTFRFPLRRFMATTFRHLFEYRCGS